ncbi:MAG: hypothetical protein F9K27_15330 [Anaerolineae bacterium]|nr:MAG: hypothetical protein F9K27_15330 [Anaerolineae bacterium]
MKTAVAESAYARDIAYQCHHDWFAEAGYIQPNVTGRYTDHFTDRSVYFLVYEGHLCREHVIGMVRVVTRAPFRTLEEFTLYDEFQYLYSEPGIMESSALCWHPQSAMQAIPHLYRAIFQFGFENGYQHIICNLDVRVLAVSQRKLKLPFRQCGYEQEYMGSLKAPVHLSRCLEMPLLPQVSPLMWDIMSQPLDPPV